MTTTGTFIASAALVGLLVAPAAASSIGSSATPQSRQMTLEREAADLVSQIERTAHEVRVHAETLAQASANPLVLPATHYHHLAMLQGLVNTRLAPAMTRLRQLQADLPEWKQASIERMFDAVSMLSSHATVAIAAKRSDPLLMPLMNDAYRDRIRLVATHAETLTRTADAAHSYATARIKAQEVGLMVSR